MQVICLVYKVMILMCEGNQYMFNAIITGLTSLVCLVVQVLVRL